jgi:hypothetical protein
MPLSAASSHFLSLRQGRWTQPCKSASPSLSLEPARSARHEEPADRRDRSPGTARARCPQKCGGRAPAAMQPAPAAPAARRMPRQHARPPARNRTSSARPLVRPPASRPKRAGHSRRTPAGPRRRGKRPAWRGLGWPGLAWHGVASTDRQTDRDRLGLARPWGALQISSGRGAGRRGPAGALRRATASTGRAPQSNDVTRMIRVMMIRGTDDQTERQTSRQTFRLRQT